MGVLSLFAALLVPLIAVILFTRARPIFSAKPLTELLFSRTWHPISGAFGFYPFIQGTLWVTSISMILAIPPSLLTAIYLSEYATPKVRAYIKPLIDLLAGVPSVVYGVWGMLTVVPFVGKFIAPLLTKTLGFIPLFQTDNPTGFSLLAGGLVLGVMVSPIIIAMSTEVFTAVPQGLREASLALGATRWHTVKHVVARRALPGIIAAVVLGFSRAFGETMAVLMVVGNVPQVPSSIFDPGYPLTALIANNYGEMMSIPMYDSALLCAAFILLMVVLVFNLISRLVLLRLTRSI
ncbi:MAG: phosphate ABC transporter permease subunit PstC [Chloroflexi bacterium RBG_16_48_8]|nr:MAG: phosphate ABC transporter permease subunit PstC [Chloroflexi bacterium RBG_16_48_8]